MSCWALTALLWLFCVWNILSVFWSCSLSPDSRESVTIRWKNEFGEDWSFHVPLQRRGDRQQLKDSWQSQWLCLRLNLYLDSLRLTNQHGGHWRFKRVGKSVLWLRCAGASASHAPSQHKGPVQMRRSQDPDSDLPWHHQLSPSVVVPVSLGTGWAFACPAMAPAIMFSGDIQIVLCVHGHRSSKAAPSADHGQRGLCGLALLLRHSSFL